MDEQSGMNPQSIQNPQTTKEKKRQDTDLSRLYSQKRYDEIIEAGKDEAKWPQFLAEDWFCIFSAMNIRTMSPEVMELYKRALPTCPVLRTRSSFNIPLCWAIYREKIRKFDIKGDWSLLFRQLDFILERCYQKDSTPRAQATFTVVRLMLTGHRTSEGQIDWPRIDRYLSVLNPALLSTEPFQGRKGHLMPSHRETWYLRKIRALHEMKDYTHCIGFVDASLRAGFTYTGDNVGRMLLAKAQSLMALNRLDEAEETLQKVLESMKRFPVYELLYRLERSRGNQSKALEYASLCELTAGQHSGRCAFMAEHAAYLQSLGETEEAALIWHELTLRQEEKPEEVPDKADAEDDAQADVDTEMPVPEAPFQLPADAVIPEDVQSLSLEETHTRLQALWRARRAQNTTWHTGVVVRVLPEGHSGFLREDDASGDGAEPSFFYFADRDFDGPHPSLETGMRLRFAATRRMDRAKNVVKPVAIRLTFLEYAPAAEAAPGDQAAPAEQSAPEVATDETAEAVEEAASAEAEVEPVAVEEPKEAVPAVEETSVEAAQTVEAAPAEEGVAAPEDGSEE